MRTHRRRADDFRDRCCKFWRALPAVLATYAWPLDVPPVLTSTFGEFRAHHFHGGLDFSTGRRLGLPVRALAQGSVVRVRASGVGYGRAVYLLLDDGRTAVYAHLDAFETELGAWVAAVQESTARYEQDLEPPAGRFRYDRGEVIGYTGESGAGPPHLHVELRADVIGLNPLVHGLPVEERVAPVIEGLWVTPASARSSVAGRFGARRWNADASGGTFRIAAPIPVSGPVRLAVQVRDSDGRGASSLGVHRVEAWLDGEPLYGARLDSLSWLETRDVKVVFDVNARAARTPSTRAYALYAPEGLRAGAAWRASSRTDAPPGRHGLRVRCEDAAGNAATLEATLAWTPAEERPEPAGSARELRLLGDALFLGGGEPPSELVTAPPLGEPVRAADGLVWEVPAAHRGPISLRWSGTESAQARIQIGRAEPGWKSEIASEDGRFRIGVGPEAAFESQLVGVEILTKPGPRFVWGATVSPAYRALPEEQPWREALDFVLEPDRGEERRVGLFRVEEESANWIDRAEFVGGLGDDGVLRGRSRSLGVYVALTDTVAPNLSGPSVRGLRREGLGRATLEVLWRVFDQGSGFSPDDVRLWVEGRAVPVEYDADSGRAVWRPHVPPQAGSHAYRIEVTDRLGNRASREGTFTNR